jgi:hypothetical protein
MRYLRRSLERFAAYVGGSGPKSFTPTRSRRIFGLFLPMFSPSHSFAEIGIVDPDLNMRCGYNGQIFPFGYSTNCVLSAIFSPISAEQVRMKPRRMKAASFPTLHDRYTCRFLRFVNRFSKAKLYGCCRFTFAILRFSTLKRNRRLVLAHAGGNA